MSDATKKEKNNTTTLYIYILGTTARIYCTNLIKKIFYTCLMRESILSRQYTVLLITSKSLTLWLSENQGFDTTDARVVAAAAVPTAAVPQPGSSEEAKATPYPLQ